MYDDVTVANYPADPEVVAGYVNGAWPTALFLPLRFPGVPLVTIDVNGTRPDADVLDMEWGDATPEMCPPWTVRHAGAPVIYCSTSRVQEVIAAFDAAGQPLPLFWSAHYTGAAHLCNVSCGLPARAVNRLVATQWADPARGSGGEYDVSLCEAGWPPA